MKLTIIIPCYNEEKTIGIIIDKVKKSILFKKLYYYFFKLCFNFRK